MHKSKGNRNNMQELKILFKFDHTLGNAARLLRYGSSIETETRDDQKGVLSATELRVVSDDHPRPRNFPRAALKYFDMGRLPN